MKELMKAIRHAARVIARPYRVRINWEGETFTHRAATMEEAVDWAAHYPEDCAALITTRTGMNITGGAGALVRTFTR